MELKGKVGLSATGVKIRQHHDSFLGKRTLNYEYGL